MVDDIDEDALKAHVNNLKHGHKKSLDNLKQTLDGEKNRKLQALEARLLRRKRQREKELYLAREGGTSETELAELDKQLRDAEAEIETEIQNTEEEFKHTKDGICNGFNDF